MIGRLSAIALVSLVACSSLVREPEVSLESLGVGSVGLGGGTLNARVRIENPNAFELEADSITYDLQVADVDSAGRWITFTQGTMREPLRVEANGATIVEVPVQFRYDQLGGAVRSLLETGTFSYRVTGQVRLTEPVDRNIPYDHTGTVSLDGVRD